MPSTSPFYQKLVVPRNRRGRLGAILATARRLRETAMPYPRDPVVQPVAIEGLRPTQMTVGMREVDDKRKRFRGHKPKKIGSISAAI